MNKQTFRKKTLARRKEIYDPSVDKQIVDRFLASDLYKQSNDIFLYISFDTEINTHDLIRQALKDGKRIYAPICDTKTHTMTLHPILSWDSLIEGAYQILTPPADSPSVLPDVLDLVILPGMAFDLDGSRMGFGGGFYDRFMENLEDRIPKVALIREAFVGPVPTEAHDQKADILVTEKRIIETSVYLARKMHEKEAKKAQELLAKQPGLQDADPKAFIASRGKWGMKLGLERIDALLEALGRPEEKLKFIHVAGTNGKGSAVTMTTDILRKAGFTVGTYMSPALERFNERIRLNGEPIADEDLNRLARQVELAAQSLDSPATGFEIETALSILYFLENQADFCVMEVGLGGRLDATNVIPSPELSLIMGISLEHTQFLGDTKEKIAAEKAGILKEDTSFVLYPQDDSVVSVMKEAASKAKVRDMLVCQQEDIELLEDSLQGQKLLYHGPEDDHVYTLNLLGAHQRLNTLTVLKGIEMLRKRGYAIPESAVSEALSEVVFTGRMELLEKDPVLMIDGAHNPNGIEALADNIHHYFPGKKIDLFFGMLEDKDVDLALNLLLPVVNRIYTLTPDSEEAMEAHAMRDKILEKTSLPVKALASVEEALDQIEENEKTEKDSVRVVTGSLYLIGKFRTAYSKRH